MKKGSKWIHKVSLSKSFNIIYEKAAFDDTLCSFNSFVLYSRLRTIRGLHERYWLRNASRVTRNEEENIYLETSSQFFIVWNQFRSWRGCMNGKSIIILFCERVEKVFAIKMLTLHFKVPRSWVTKYDKTDPSTIAFSNARQSNGIRKLRQKLLHNIGSRCQYALARIQK